MEGSSQVVVLASEGKTSKKSMIQQLFKHHVRTLKNARNQDSLFLLEIRDELMKIGNLTYQQAEKILRTSSVALQFDSTFLHEPPAYWAFSILYGTHELWHQKFEKYIKGK